MKFTHEHQFHASMDEVARMLASDDFVNRRGVASGADRADAVVDGEPTGAFTVSIRRVMPAKSIPSEFQSFVGRELDVKYTEAWEPPGRAERVGTFVVEIAGAPGRVTGALELKQDGDITTLFAVGNATAPVPLVGHMIEKAVSDNVVKAFRAELVVADEWLESNT